MFLFEERKYAMKRASFTVRFNRYFAVDYAGSVTVAL